MTEFASAQAIVDSAFAQVVGRRGWSPAVGVGSFLTIDFGATRVTSTGNSQGEFHLWIYGAPWEIRVRGKVVAESNDDRQVMSSGALILAESTLHGFRFDPREMTLMLQFDSADLWVSGSDDPDTESWLLYLNDGTVITAGPGGSVVRESASG